MTTKHTPTPGPWRVDVAQYDDGTIRSVDVREAQYGLFIAAVEAHTTEHVDVMANARLIAAAPELLAALREMERCGVLDNGMIAGPAKQARAALAKADGTDPGLEAHRREKAREAAADLADLMPDALP